METDISAYKVHRKQLKSSLTRAGKYLDKSEAALDIEQCKARYEKFTYLYDEFNRVQSRIEVLDELELENTERDNFEEKYFELEARFRKMMGVSETSGVTETSSDVVKLPTIELPKFSGAYEDWLGFYDTFHSLIHNNGKIPTVHKFHYLKSCLKGDAANVLHSLEISADNYASAWQTLQERYSNKRVIVQKHINAIFELPSAAKENLNILRCILDGVQKHSRALTALKRPVDQWDDLLVHIISKKLDCQTFKEWENKIQGTEMPTFKKLTDFLTQKCQTLEAIGKPTQSILAKTANVTTNKASIICTFCNGNHSIYQCKQFTGLSVDQRLEKAKSKRLCLNCLRTGHIASKCTAKECKHCNKRHNSLLHYFKAEQPEKFPSAERPEKLPSVEPGTSSSVTTLSSNSVNVHTMLSTAVINAIDVKGRKHDCRVLLDSGSQSNMITNRMVKLLRLQKINTNIVLSGINQTKREIPHSVNVAIKSKHNGFERKINCLVLDKISEKLPLVRIPREHVKVPNNIRLADPEFNVPKDIDMLIGIDLFYQLLCVGQIQLHRDGPFLQKTLFGWIVAGKIVVPETSTNVSVCNASTLKLLNDSIKRFWEIETVSERQMHSQEESYCELHFAESTERQSDGRFVVSLPFKGNVNTLGGSYEQALKRFDSLERKFKRNPTLKQEYTAFMNEYLQLGHMKLVDNPERDKPHFYLPHHAVIKENSLTTKVRVVFDGSAKTTTGLSLNDTLMVGPKLQQDLFDIICRFRLHKYVLTADVAKMYRQVGINEKCMPFQRILWRNSETENIQTFELTTVTYGTASASYLAIKALQQTALAEENTYEIGTEIILRDFYVDDLLTGADTLSGAKEIINEVTAILQKGKFELRKWASNKPELLQTIPNSCNNHTVLNLDKGEDVNTLGLQWNTSTDTLQYSSIATVQRKNITKRHVLSHISKIFDPLGLISPFTVRAKMLMQEVWKLSISWDESLPMKVSEMWLNYAQEINGIAEIEIPRHVVTIDNPYYFELHGFCDASEKAYGSCVYLRAVDKHGTVSCHLLCSKSRVAPVKQITLPRLELSGALLLAQLVNRLKQTLSIPIRRVYYWTDSSIVIAWLNSSKALKTFVANRIGEIRELSNVLQWHHVDTRQNPADLVSRGSSLQTLKNDEMWWEGPSFLQESAEKWPTSEFTTIIELPEVKSFVSTEKVTEEFTLFTKYSDLNKLKRVVAYCLRFAANVKARMNKEIDHINNGHLTTADLSKAMLVLTKKVQKQCFKEYTLLERKRQLHSSSNILSLNPFMDKDGLIRVGGRLGNSNIPYCGKHQILLPAKHPFTNLIIKCEHIKQLHAGTQQTMAAIRTKYWPLSLKGSVKAYIRKCITCFKAKPKSENYIMADLPAHRVTPAKPFQNVGIDYFGPLYIRESTKKKHNVTKAYGAVFVCFATKAVHIELVGNLSTEAFLAALKRVVARRGKIENIYSDNGTQFVGANVELKKLLRQLQSQITQEEVQGYLANNEIKWNFIPPRSPHFGGLWEAAVKSTKLHLNRIIGKTTLTYEEMYTLLVQIEGILNSRPLTSLSNDPNDFHFLTPSHFLMGYSPETIPEPTLTHLKVNSLSRWQHIQFMRDHFWKRWHREYLNQLQQRNKWQRANGNGLTPGQLVILREDQGPPSKWLMGRITEVFPGSDGIVRAAAVSTSQGIMKRPAVKLCALPIDN